MKMKKYEYKMDDGVQKSEPEQVEVAHFGSTSTNSSNKYAYPNIEDVSEEQISREKKQKLKKRMLQERKRLLNILKSKK